MNGPTDDFDLALQVRAGILDQIVEAQHRAGILRHHYMVAHGRRRVELLVNNPSLTLITAAQADGLARASLRARIHYHSRDLFDTADVGDGAVADVTVRAAVSLSTGDPAPLAGGADLLITLETPSAADIVVQGASAALVAQITDVVRTLVEGQPNGRFRLPPIGGTGRQVGSLGFRFLADPAGGQVLTIGMNAGNVVKGDKARLSSTFVQRDWALAISGAFLLAELRAGLSSHLGSRLPPPNGPAPVLIADREVCTLPSPFGCIDRSRQRVFIVELDVGLEPGSIVFTGRLLVTSTAFYVPDINVNFLGRVTLEIAADQSLRPVLGPLQVDAQGFFADLANFFSGGALEAAVENAVRAAFQSGIQQGVASGFFSTGLLRQIAGLGNLTPLQLDVNAGEVEIRADAVVLQGSLNVLDRSAAPQGQMSVFRPNRDLTRRLFFAGQVWSPGRALTAYTWDFGDGQSDTRTGINVRLTIAHDYQPGIYNACLTVSDDQGQLLRRCQTVETARLRLRHTPGQYQGHTLQPWDACQTTQLIPAEFFVYDEQTPVPDALVTVEGQHGYLLQAHTDAQGRVTFQIDITNDHARPDGLGRGIMIVRASKSGYVSAPFEELAFIDCSRLFELVDREGLVIRDLSDRYRKLLDLIGPRGPVDPDGPFPPLSDGRAIEPSRLSEIALALDILTKLAVLTERGSDVLHVATLLGIDAGPEFFNTLGKRFDAAVAGVSKAMDKLASELERPVRG